MKLSGSLLTVAARAEPGLQPPEGFSSKIFREESQICTLLEGESLSFTQLLQWCLYHFVCLAVCSWGILFGLPLSGNISSLHLIKIWSLAYRNQYQSQSWSFNFVVWQCCAFASSCGYLCLCCDGIWLKTFEVTALLPSWLSRFGSDTGLMFSFFFITPFYIVPCCMNH